MSGNFLKHFFQFCNLAAEFAFPCFCVCCGRLGDWFCQECKKEILAFKHPKCPVCKKPSIGGKTHPKCCKPYCLDGLLVCAHYCYPIKEAIYEFKYRWVKNLARDLGDMLTDHIKNTNSLEISLFTVVPIPLDEKRLKWRGFNQSFLLASRVALNLGLECDDVLGKRKVKAQAEIRKRSDRQKNVSGAFYAKKKVKGKILLVDDVCTTGSTLASAAKVLKKNGASQVWGATLASR